MPESYISYILVSGIDACDDIRMLFIISHDSMPEIRILKNKK